MTTYTTAADRRATPRTVERMTVVAICQTLRTSQKANRRNIRTPRTGSTIGDSRIKPIRRAARPSVRTKDRDDAAGGRATTAALGVGSQTNTNIEPGLSGMLAA